MSHSIIKHSSLLTKLLIEGGREESKFCVFLGAGASVSSGIPTAKRLVSEWIVDLHKVKENKHNHTCQQDTLKNNKFKNGKAFNKWYKTLKSSHSIHGNNVGDYSFLIEYFHPTSSLRQAFIEKETKNKYPGFGYLYLSMLIDSGYFNVTFTTNFDDLINDALYRYVDLRPLVCSFDSSVKSIRIASKRPKIIKLHGDYLFDNIRNTSNEVRNLSVNMEQKFKEFCKEYGMIVIGYSGDDDSIMDIINHMLKDDEYLKMGLHWCLMKDKDTPQEERFPEKLRSAIGHTNRLHFYEIESFDILMSNLAKTAKLELPVELLYPRQSKTITKLTDCAKVQKNSNLSEKILLDTKKILDSLLKEGVTNDIRIKDAHMEGKLAQKYRDYSCLKKELKLLQAKGVTIDKRKLAQKCRNDSCLKEAKKLLQECIKQCDTILKRLKSKSNTLSQSEKLEIHTIKAIALVGKAKINIMENSKPKEVIEILKKSQQILKQVEDDCESLENSKRTQDRELFCRYHFNSACILGLISESDPKTTTRNWKIAKRHLSSIKTFREAEEFITKIKINDEPDLHVFSMLKKFKSVFN